MTQQHDEQAGPRAQHEERDPRTMVSDHNEVKDLEIEGDSLDNIAGGPAAPKGPGRT